ncbi:carbapenam-3-carboxylate synthase domain-containing protein [Photorhabdus laumondii]|uniref:carbapenam-3-carboxylate synthase domain-containing protein n=1 Tax=Photorhabdus laumondii TaxID=2218628 RepID=UPI000D4AE657|nr:carbapenam-3-carboxylate synthase domain-containing protein [Photorhabdus laumondii]PQQ36978.1 hypothetical protein C6H68_15665 [Photorhabdus luminescens]
MGSEFCFVKYCFDKNLNELTNEFQFDELSTGRILFRNTTNVSKFKSERYTQWISRCIATARERIPGSIGNYVTGVSECSQQRGSLKDDGYICFYL